METVPAGGFPEGSPCASCERIFEPGDSYFEHTVGFYTDDDPLEGELASEFFVPVCARCSTPPWEIQRW